MDKLKFFNKNTIPRYSRPITSNFGAETGNPGVEVVHSSVSQYCIMDSRRISKESETNFRAIDRELAKSEELRASGVFIAK